MKVTIRQYRNFFDQYKKLFDDESLYTDGEIVEINGHLIVNDFFEEHHRPEEEIDVLGGWFISEKPEASHLHGRAIVPIFMHWLATAAQPEIVTAEVPAHKILQFKKACEQMGVIIK